MDMDLILETFATLALLCYYIIEGVIKAILPIKYLPKKDISNDIVLVTGAGESIISLCCINFASTICLTVSPPLGTLSSVQGCLSLYVASPSTKMTFVNKSDIY